MGNTSDILLACAKGDLKSVASILEHAPERIGERSQRDETPLAVAWLCKQTEVVRFLLERGASARVKDRTRDTPLHHAMLEGDERSAEIVRLLIASGADVNARGNGGMTPLEVACANYDESLDSAIEFLLKRGAVHTPYSALLCGTDADFEEAWRREGDDIDKTGVENLRWHAEFSGRIRIREVLKDFQRRMGWDDTPARFWQVVPPDRPNSAGSEM